MNDGPVYLKDYADVFESILPGIELRPAIARGVIATWHIKVEHRFDRAVSPEHAKAEVTTLAERMRLRAIRELGLEPILRAQQDEVNETMMLVKQLQSTCNQRAAKIAELEEKIEGLETQIAEENGT